MSNVKELKKKDLDSLNKGVHVVKFWAAWCGFCKKAEPIYEEVALELKGKKVTFLKLNIDDEKEFATLHQVRGVPTTKIFKDGKVVETITGFKPKEDFVAILKNHI